MTAVGLVSASLTAELRELARQHGVVVWLDKEGSFVTFADALAKAGPTGSVLMRTFRGSYLETMLALEDLQDGVTMTPMVLHVPGHTEDSIADTPLFELYRAGRRHRRSLATLVREAAHGRATPTAIDAFLAQAGLTLEGADAWLARPDDPAAANDGPDLSLHSAEALFDDMAGRGPLAQKLGRPEVSRAVWRRAEVLLGITDDDRRRLLEEAEDEPTGRASSTAEVADDVATALARWVLAVEFVHDLRRPPTDAWLLPLQHLAKPVVATCQKLATHLRRGHDRHYARIAVDMEPLLPTEVAQATADDLGKIDTFQFEDTKVMAAALDALLGARFQRARELALARTSGKSFWTAYDLRRRIAWNLVERAAQLGCQVLAHGGLLTGCTSLADAVARYAADGYLVDRAHRQLEQAREELPQLDLPEASLLRARLDQLRGVYRGWADEVARGFNLLCRREGFLPPAALQQRTLFDEVVVPAVAEDLTAYFMVDALRFEMGVQLAEGLRETRTADVTVSARLAELPTITEVGMNALAPVVRAGKLTVDYKGDKILGFRAGELRVDGPDDRRRAIHDRLGGDACPRLSLEEVGQRDATSLRKALARARAVVVHCEGIDKAGEKGVGLAVFERELQLLRAAWGVLYAAGVKRFVFTADHGFLLHDEVTRDALRHGKQTDPQRRHVLTHHRREQAGEVCVSASELDYEGAEFHAAFPEGIAPFDRGARAKDFVHGGNSLQERVIPVVTVRHRHAAGGEKVSYQVEARGGLAVAGMHSLVAVVQPTRQTNLVYGSSAEVELALESADEADVQVELCDVHHARRTGAGVVATVGTEFAVFFRLTGDVETRAAVRVRPASQVTEVTPAVTSERFQVILRARPVVPAAAQAGVAPAVARPPVPAAWLDALPPGVREVFRHLADHGSINEEEATRLLGGPRQFRAFSRDLDTYRVQAPFGIRVEVTTGTKCYVRGDPERS
ncbi:MAG: BREX-6 system phosphatase PglZ [Kofleriaceae bacterium]|nr:BREX-6 system phosphatase PglZ [Kofleriaceae bacterium]